MGNVAEQGLRIGNSLNPSGAEIQGACLQHQPLAVNRKHMVSSGTRIQGIGKNRDIARVDVRQRTVQQYRTGLSIHGFNCSCALSRSLVQCRAVEEKGVATDGLDFSNGALLAGKIREITREYNLSKGASRFARAYGNYINAAMGAFYFKAGRTDAAYGYYLARFFFRHGFVDREKSALQVLSRAPGQQALRLGKSGIQTGACGEYRLGRITGE